MEALINGNLRKYFGKKCGLEGKSFMQEVHDPGKGSNSKKYQKSITSVPSILSQGFYLACEISGPMFQLLTCLYLRTTFYVPYTRHHNPLLNKDRKFKIELLKGLPKWGKKYTNRGL